MKLNKFSLGLGVALMGTIAAFASTQKAPTGSYFYISSGGTSCQPITTGFQCSEGGTQCVAPGDAPVPGAQLYLRLKTSPTNPLPCSVTLRPQAGF